MGPPTQAQESPMRIMVVRNSAQCMLSAARMKMMNVATANNPDRTQKIILPLVSESLARGMPKMAVTSGEDSRNSPVVREDIPRHISA